MSSLKLEHMRWQAAQAKFTEGLNDVEIAELLDIPRTTLNDFFLRKSYKSFWEEWDSLNHSGRPEGPRISLFDIETSPVLAYIWSLYDKFTPIEAIVEDWFLLCFGYKWLGEEDVYVHALPDYPDYVKGKDCEQLLVEKLWEVLDESDIVIAHNAVKFDVRKANAKFLQYDLPIPSPYKVVDTLQIVKENFNTVSNKLDYYTKFLGGQGKLEHEGLKLWLGCINGDKESWRTMISYNYRDITELENVYLGVRKWSRRHPNVANYYSDTKERCVVCGHDEFKSLKAPAVAGMSLFEAIECLNCGKHSRRRTNLKSKNKMANTLTNITQ